MTSQGKHNALHDKIHGFEIGAIKYGFITIVLRTDITPPILIATDPRGVKMYSPENETLQIINTEATSGGVAFDFETGTVYWSAISGQYGIFRAKIDGSGAECIKNNTGLLSFHANDLLKSSSSIYAKTISDF